LDEECCTIEGPVGGSTDNFLNLGNTETKDTLSFYFVYSKEDFGTYLETQKQTFIDDYIVVNKTSPSPVQKTINVGSKTAYLLEGYSYRKNDLIFLDVTKDERKITFLVISILNNSGEEFEEELNSILSSFVFE
jgi:hypothetical protein